MSPAAERTPTTGQPRRALQPLPDTNSRKRPFGQPYSKSGLKGGLKGGQQGVKHTVKRSTTTVGDNDSLWKKLREKKMAAFMRDTTASTQRSKGRATSQSATSRSLTQSNVSSDARKAKMRDPDFRKRVLVPRQISFPLDTESSDAFAHFRTDEAPQSGYGSLEPLRHTNVWLNKTDSMVDDIIREYTYMKNEQLCEAEFASYAREHLLRRDQRYPSHEEAREWRVERMIEPVVKPGPNRLWRPPPPVVEPDSVEYDFDVRPDCEYWLSVRSFNSEYARLFSRYIYIHNDRITAPYLTIEFKKDDKSLEKAQNQIAAAAAMALYNRCLAKVQRLKNTGKLWTAKHTSELRHYGLILQGAHYAFWCVRLKEAGPISPSAWSWPGCEIVATTNGNLLTKPNVRHFIDWLNEIHRWGLSVHGPSCQKDVKFCIEAKEKNVRTSLFADDHNPDSDVDEE